MPICLFQLTQPCFISCPGDCLVSDWSAWGPCHRPCEPQTSSEGNVTANVWLIFVSRAAGNLVPGDYAIACYSATGLCILARRHHWSCIIAGVLLYVPNGGRPVNRIFSRLRRLIYFFDWYWPGRIFFGWYSATQFSAQIQLKFGWDVKIVKKKKYFPYMPVGGQLLY